LSTSHDWLVKNAIVDLPNKMKGISKTLFQQFIESLGSQSKDIGAASQTLLTEVKLGL